MQNCISNCDNKSFTLDTPPNTSGYLKKIVNDIQKIHIKCFATGIHQKYEYQRFTKSKSNLIKSKFYNNSLTLKVIL